MPRHDAEIHVLHVRLDGLELRAGRRVGVDVGDRPPRCELGGDHLQRPLERRQLIAAHRPSPNPPPQLVHRAHRLRFEQDFAPVDDRHAVAQLLDVLDDVRREDHDAVLTDLAEQVEEADALLRVEPGRRLVDDDQLRVADAARRRRRGAAACRRRRCRLAACARPTGSCVGAATRRRRAAAHARRRPSAPRSDRADAPRSLLGGSRTTAAGSRASRERDPSGGPRRCCSKRIAPASGSCSVATIRISVDLPAPFRPSRPYMPAGIVRVTLFSACTPLG